MNDAARYLDHAATSWPKPPEVRAAVLRFLDDVGVSAARGDGARCAAAAAEVDAARLGIARRCGVPAERVAFCSGATEGLNLVLRALLRPGDRVVTTAFEHSSMVRPLLALQRERGLAVDVVPPTAEGDLDPSAVASALRAAPTRLLAFSHASNVTGAVFDAVTLCGLARSSGALSLVDACQTAGHLPLTVGADVLVASCHKGLLAPPGLGFVAAAPHVDLPAQKQGGTGSSRALAEHPDAWPLAFEAGTPNTLALFGLAAALRRDAVAPSRLDKANARLQRFLDAAARLPGLRFLPAPAARRLPVAAFTLASYDPAELGAICAGAGFHVRTGHLCAPWLLRHFGAESGVVRISLGHADVDDALPDLLALLRDVAGG